MNISTTIIFVYFIKMYIISSYLLSPDCNISSLSFDCFLRKKTTAQPPQASPPNAVHQQPASVACSTPPQSLTFPHVMKSLLNSTVMELTQTFILSEKCQAVTDVPRPSS